MNSGFNYLPRGVDFYSTKDGIMSSKDTYFTFNNLSGKSANEIQSILQLDSRNTPSSYAQFNTFQVINDIRIPYGQWNNASYVESITKDYPRFGTGGATQVITNTPIENYIIKGIHK